MFKGNVRRYKKLLTYFLCDDIWLENFFSIIKLVFPGNIKFYLFYYNAIFKERVLQYLNRLNRALKVRSF